MKYKIKLLVIFYFFNYFVLNVEIFSCDVNGKEEEEHVY